MLLRARSTGRHGQPQGKSAGPFEIGLIWPEHVDAMEGQMQTGREIDTAHHKHAEMFGLLLSSGGDSGRVLRRWP